MNVSTIRYFLFALTLCFTINASAQKHLKKGDPVPLFSLTDQTGKDFNIANQIGKHRLVIYFYPKDESMVCTKEACAFRDMFNEFTKAGALVIGINDGTVASHNAFAEHYKLPFVLLSDPGNKIYNMFGIKNKLFMSGRETFIVDLNGIIVYSHAAMLQGKAHAEDALEALRSAI